MILFPISENSNASPVQAPPSVKLPSPQSFCITAPGFNNDASGSVPNTIKQRIKLVIEIAPGRLGEDKNLKSDYARSI
jgi:hypothetical protein